MMYQRQRILERELRFTEAYRAHQQEDRSTREYYCLKEQTPTLFVAPREQDLIAGRIDRPNIGFFPIFEGDYVDKVAYCIDEAACLEDLKRMEEDPHYSEAEVAAAREMIKFWQRENTNAKIRARFPARWRNSMGADDYQHVPGAIHPLYRIASANLDWQKFFRLGLCGMIALLEQRAAEANTDGERALFQGMAGVMELIRGVVRDYAAEAERMLARAKDGKRRMELVRMRDSLLHILDQAPETLQQALQLQNIYMLAGRTTEIGRLDDYLCQFYRRDLANGVLTREEAIRLIDNFFTITQEERGRDTRAIIGGLGRKNPELADEFDLVILDVLERRKFAFYPQVSLRCYKGMDERVLDRSLELLGQGYTFPLLYNDDVNVPGVMRAMDVPRAVAEQYSFFGCGEYMIASKSIGTPNTAMNIAKILELTLHNGTDPLTGEPCGLPTGEITDAVSFDELMARLSRQIEFFSDISGDFQQLLYDVCAEECSFLLMSPLFDDCIARGKSMFDGGLYHVGGTVETYGNVTAEDSMAAIKEVVYGKQAFTLTHLVEVLDANFTGFEREHALLLNAKKFGNDYAEADDIAVTLHETICNAVRRQRERTNLDSFLVVIINNSMNVTLGHYVGATADGRLAGAYLSNGNSPYNGRDHEGVTALIRSLTKMDCTIHAGGNQNLKFSKEMFRNNLGQIKAVLRSFFDLGGQQTNLTVVDQAELEDAMVHPENHRDLVVRVGGFSARFVELDPEIQLDVLQRTAY